MKLFLPLFALLVLAGCLAQPPAGKPVETPVIDSVKPYVEYGNFSQNGFFVSYPLGRRDVVVPNEVLFRLSFAFCSFSVAEYSVPSPLLSAKFASELGGNASVSGDSINYVLSQGKFLLNETTALKECNGKTYAVTLGCDQSVRSQYDEMFRHVLGSLTCNRSNGTD